MAPVDQSRRTGVACRLLGGTAAVWAFLAAAVLLFPRPLADVFFTGWVVGAVGLAVLGGAGAWTHRVPLIWVAAILLSALSILGMWSIGLFIAPAAILLLGAALTGQLAGTRTRRLKAADIDPSMVRRAVSRVLVGTATVVLGAWLAYEGTFVRELFTAGCATETLDCALAVTRWDAVGLTLLGLVAISGGGWLVWRQAEIGRALAARQVGWD